MVRSGPLLTLGSVVALAGILLTVDLRISSTASKASPVATASPVSATASAAPGGQGAAAPARALFAGRTSGDEFTVAIAINGGKAAADLNAGLPSQASLAGSVAGGQVTLTGANGVRLTGSVSSAAVFGS